MRGAVKIGKLGGSQTPLCHLTLWPSRWLVGKGGDRGNLKALNQEMGCLSPCSGGWSSRKLFGFLGRLEAVRVTGRASPHSGRPLGRKQVTKGEYLAPRKGAGD